MKKIMSLMLGLSLVLGAASMAFAQMDTSKKDTSKSTDKKSSKKGKKKGTDDTTKKS